MYCRAIFEWKIPDNTDEVHVTRRKRNLETFMSHISFKLMKLEFFLWFLMP